MKTILLKNENGEERGDNLKAVEIKPFESDERILGPGRLGVDLGWTMIDAIGYLPCQRRPQCVDCGYMEDGGEGHCWEGEDGGSEELCSCVR